MIHEFFKMGGFVPEVAQAHADAVRGASAGAGCVTTASCPARAHSRRRTFNALTSNREAALEVARPHDRDASRCRRCVPDLDRHAVTRHARTRSAVVLRVPYSGVSMNAADNTRSRSSGMPVDGNRSSLRDARIAHQLDQHVRAAAALRAWISVPSCVALVRRASATRVSSTRSRCRACPARAAQAARSARLQYQPSSRRVQSPTSRLKPL